MPPKATLPSCFLSSVDGKQIKCTYCAPFEPDVRKHWIQRTSLAAHMKAVQHQRCSTAHEEQQAQARQAQLRRDLLQQEFISLQQLSALKDLGSHLEQQDREKRQSRDSEQGEPGMTGEERAMWTDYSLHGATFSLGEDPSERVHTELDEEINNFRLQDARQTAYELGFGSETDDNNDTSTVRTEGLAQDEQYLADILAESYKNSPFDSLDDERPHVSDSQWAPYESKTMFLLDLLLNLPRLRISESLMKVFLWIMEQAGARDVPSFYRLQKIQKELRMQGGVSTTKFQSVQGNVFYINDPREIIAKDWSNPLIRPHIHVYPEIPDGPVSEVWHGEKWCKDMDLDTLSPMYNTGDRHFYVNKLTRLYDGSLVIPFRWIVYHNAVHAESWKVIVDDQGMATVHDEGEPLMVPASEMTDNYFDLEHGHELPQTWSAHSHANGFPSAMLNHLREVAGGDPLYTSFTDYFGDDVSGNRSKSWNKHWNAYIVHRNLPRALLQQQYHTHFISTSPHATISEQFVAFKQTIESTHQEPVRVLDAATGKMARFRIFVSAAPSDNSMQSELSSHIGGGSNLFCRKCNVGGTTLEKESTEGYESLFHSGTLQSKEKILKSLETQVDQACTGVKQHLLACAKVMKEANRKRSTEDFRSELQQWVHDHQDEIYSSFLTLKGFDPTKDTPIEILHTILLGLVKYGWHLTHKSWDPTQKPLYALRLQSTMTSGLSLPAIRASYIMQYANSLIGRQLKTVAQTSVFHVHDLIGPLEFQLWKAIGELSALMWFREIHNMQLYLDDVDVAVGNVLDLFAEIDPLKIIQKLKLHLQLHAREDILRFGPLVGVCTEGFECYNAVFRFCSILSNHLAPSRDIAIQLADQEALKHRLTGGSWATSQNEWISAGYGVQDMLVKHPLLQRLVGWSPTTVKSVGASKAKPLKQGMKTRPIVQLSKTKAPHTLNYCSFVATSEWIEGISFVTQSKDDCTVGPWVFAEFPLNTELLVGRVNEIWISNTVSSQSIVILELFQVAASRHPTFGMPFLTCCHGEPSSMLLPTTSIKFDFNVQHDCLYAGCTASGSKPQVQEQTESGKTEMFVEHHHDTTADCFIVNMHAFHNAHLIRLAVPRTLSAPQPLYADCTSKHAEISARLRTSQGEKRATQKENREAKKAAGHSIQKEAHVGEEANVSRKRKRQLDSVPEGDQDELEVGFD
ncbi:hypothetical protein BC835DRAFT_1424616 [Cytidiella melzeri]|nr:hypothetical protein BC835DRAFT_1424616 [Cytidiella melzeri]